MTDDQAASQSGQGIGSPPGAGVLPIHMIPEDTLKAWINVPSNTPITIAITKQEIDNLYFAISNALMALDTTNRAFVQWSNKQVIEAQNGLEESRRSIVSGLDCLRYFFEAVISRATER